MSDLGLTHIALGTEELDATIAFYERYARMQVVHRRLDPASGRSVVWLSDRTRPFVIVLVEMQALDTRLSGFAHLGVACESREEVDRLCRLAREESRPTMGPFDSGYPVGYWAFIGDPNGHNLEVSYGQEIGLTVAQGSRGSS
jgi:catechol 2,3-dioxygenase-like lactoylglutathione lyase family enzyme